MNGVINTLDIYEGVVLLKSESWTWDEDLVWRMKAWLYVLT